MDIYQLDTYLANLTPHQMKIVQVMYDADGEWLTRAMVAKRLGKRRLTPYDINCLTMLSQKNILAISTQPTTAPGSEFAYIYTMLDDVAMMLQEWSEVKNQLHAENEQRETRKPINLFDDK